MSVPLYNQPNGVIAFYIPDPGDGIPFDGMSRTDSSEKLWWEVRIWSGERGFLDPDDGWGATARFY